MPYPTDTFPERLAALNGPIKSLRASYVQQIATMEKGSVPASTILGIVRQAKSMRAAIGSGKDFFFAVPAFTDWVKGQLAQDPGNLASDLDVLSSAIGAVASAAVKAIPLSGDGFLLVLSWVDDVATERLFGPDETAGIREAMQTALAEIE